MLVATYQGRYVPSHQQLRAAFKAIEYERPKLQATAILKDENSFALALERANNRSASVGVGRLIEGTVGDADAKASE
jgi:hypothetical protein